MTSNPPPPQLSTAAAFAALVAGAIAMGISPIFVRLAEVGPFAGAFWRCALALPPLYLWMRLEERSRASTHVRADGHGQTTPARPVSFARPTLLAGTFFAGDLFFWHLSILNTTVANATFFATTAPIWVVLVVWAVYRQSIGLPTLIGLAFCLAGGGALVAESLDVDPQRLRGDLYGVATAVFFGLYFLAVQAARGYAGAGRVIFESTLVTASILLVIALLFDPRFLPATWNGAMALLAMALISHAGGQGLLALALGRLSPVFSSLVIFLEAVAAAAFGWLVLGENLSLVQVLGGALILAGLWVARPQAPPTVIPAVQP